MNPPHEGHQKLVDKIRVVASQVGGEPHVFLSHSQDKKKNPLDYLDKVRFAMRAFGKIVKRSKSATIIQVMQELQKKKFTDVVLVVGSDRVQSLRKLLEQYNGKDYYFENVSVVSAGQRDPDAEGVEGMSASKMRQLAKDEDEEQFRSGLPPMIQKDAKKIMNSVRKGMKL